MLWTSLTCDVTHTCCMVSHRLMSFGLMRKYTYINRKVVKIHSKQSLTKGLHHCSYEYKSIGLTLTNLLDHGRLWTQDPVPRCAHAAGHHSSGQGHHSGQGHPSEDLPSCAPGICLLYRLLSLIFFDQRWKWVRYSARNQSEKRCEFSCRFYFVGKPL